jgi:hypothetical protein
VYGCIVNVANVVVVEEVVVGDAEDVPSSMVEVECLSWSWFQFKWLFRA